MSEAIANPTADAGSLEDMVGDAPFAAGERVQYCGYTATVVADHGSSGIVDVDGEGRMTWHWKAYGDFVGRIHNDSGEPRGKT